jgi:tetratricopeptide (TPR) repeat protein
MYERYEPAEKVFVDREKNLDWMKNALTYCKDQSVVLHLRGIGGIGKSALIEHWNNCVEASILLDCSRVTDFFDRLNALAKGAVRLGISLRRFDLLWSIRLRFVQGVEPAKEPGRSWAFTVIKPLPFIGSLANIGNAIRVVGMKLRPIMKRRLGDVANWLQTRLGKDYTEKLLEILWKDPHHVEILFLDALMEDLNARKNSQQPILLMFDHFEDVDSEHIHWRFSGRKISETELWYEYLSSLNNTVVVIASRRAVPERLSKEVIVEEVELTELDKTSCRDLLKERGVKNKEQQERIVSLSGGNPFVLNTICDLAEIGKLSLEDIESLRADTLEQVRIKTWRRLFNQSKDLSEIIDRAGLLPFFDRRTLAITAPTMKSTHWDHLTHLSFVRDRGDGTWELHNLARELVLAELGDMLSTRVDEVAELLEHAATKHSDATLQGLAFSVTALVDEPKAIAKVRDKGSVLLNTHPQEALSLLSCVRFVTDEGVAMLHWLKGRTFATLLRVAESEQELQEALRLYREFAVQEPDKFQIFVGWTLSTLAYLFTLSGRFSEAEETYQETIPLLQELVKREEKIPLHDQSYLVFNMMSLPSDRLANTYRSFADFLYNVLRFNEAEVFYLKALTLFRELAKKVPQAYFWRNISVILRDLSDLCLHSGRPLEAEEMIQEAVELVRERAKDDPYGQYLVGTTLAVLARVYLMTDRPLEGIELAQEVVEISREAIKGPAIPDFFVGWTLNYFSILLLILGRKKESEDALLEAVDIFRREKEPYRWQIELPYVLNNFAILLRQTGRFKEAEKIYKEALTLLRQLADQAPKFRTAFLPVCLRNFGVLLRQTGDLTGAEAAFRETLVFRRGITNMSDFTLPRVATSLNDLGVVLSETKRMFEAEEMFQEALRIRRSIAKKTPSFYLSELASTLNNLGILFTRTERFVEAEQFYREALEIWEQLTKKVPTLYQSNLIMSLTNLGILLTKTKVSSVAVQKIMDRLRELGVTQLEEVEQWSEEEELGVVGAVLRVVITGNR